MAENMIFPIGFDLGKAVKNAGDDWDKKYAKQLEDLIAKRPVNVKLKLDTKKLDSLDAVNKRLAELKIEPITPNTKAAIKELAAELKTLAKALEQVQKYSTRAGGTPEAVQNSKIALNEERAKAQAALTAQRAARAEYNLAAARDKDALAATRGTKATQSLSREYKAQDGYISRIIKRLAVYAGLRQIANFLTMVREVTAQFELQRVSLGAIIQDQERANQLFAEIKSFALTSPLKILDLTKYTKQVAAYGIEVNKLFDTTKMLADISVGLGVRMERLTLFFGQVYATGYLRASEVRQATEAGIPLVDKLAKKLTEANGKLVSAAEVMGLISKRAISFEMVEEVFKDMTSAGGEFYNMQVMQSQTLFGMWSKLGDAAALMYDQIGNTSSVNSAMKTTIGLLEKMMRNWQTTARVLDTVVTAVAVYAIGLKNANIASKTLAGTTALLNLAHKQQIIQTPKIVAAIIGQNAAMRLSTVLTKAHTAAILREAVATNILTKGFWKLTAAMLANPWIAAAAAIGAAVAALVHFTGNAETAAARTEKLNNAVVSLKNLDDIVQPLINTYNELINKTERTAEEEKKLSAVTHELAERYPGAVTAIGNFGAEVGLAADELNELYQAEKNARMENLRNELDKTEKKIKETQEKIGNLQRALTIGVKTIVIRTSYESIRSSESYVPLTDKDKDELLKRIDALRNGEDGHSGLVGLKQSAENARRALGLIPSETAQAVEKFGAWKKTLTTFQQQVGNIRVQLFDDSTIAQFSSLEDALKETAKKYKENIASVEFYNDVLKSTTHTEEELAQIEAERAEADAMATLAKKVLDYYNTLATAFDKGSGRTADHRLNNLKEEISLTKKLYDEYKKLEKQIGATKAAEKIQEIYSNTIKTLRQRAGKYDFTFELPFTDENLKANMQQFISKMKELQKLTDKKGKPLFPNIGKDIDQAVAQLEDVDFNSLQKTLEQKLKELSDKISRTKTAKEFYDRILSQTGDVDLAMNVTMSIYGDTGEGLFNSMVEQIRQSFTSGNADIDLQITADIDTAIDMTNQRINYQKLAEIYDKYQKHIIGQNRLTAENIITEGQKTAAANILTWEKELAKAKDYEQQRTDIIKRETQNRAEIIKSYGYTSEEKKQKIALSYDAQAKELAELSVEEFKNSEDYIKVFQDLDRVSTRTLNRMKTRLEEMIKVAKSAENVQGLKALVEQLEKIKQEKETRNPMAGVIDGLKEYARAQRDYHKAQADEAKAKAVFAKEEADLNKAITVAKNEQAEAQSKVDQLLQTGRENTDEYVTAQLKLEEATGKVTTAENNLRKATEKVKVAEKKTTDELDKQKAALKKIQASAQATASAFNSAASSIQSLAELFGVAEDSELGDIVNGFVSGLQTAASVMTTIATIAAVIEAECWWMLAIGAVIAAFGALFSWLTGSKIRKANEEIERQQELLDNLEYTYGRLEKAAEKLFGTEYIANYTQQLETLKAQAEAYSKQADAERSKGKDADRDKIKDYETKARDTIDKIRDMEKDLVSHFLGSDMASTAREFAKAWLEAKASFGSTIDAMKSKYKELIQNIIIEGFAARAINSILEDTWNNVDKLLAEGKVEDAASYMADNMDETLTKIDYAMNVMTEALKKKGIDIKEVFGDNDSEFTGIKRNIATASEESINGLAQGIHTQNFYMSFVPKIHEDVSLIAQKYKEVLQQPETGDGINLLDLVTLQNQYLNSLPAIEANTAATAERCERAAIACEEMAAQISRVIKPRGVSSTFVLHTS